MSDPNVPSETSQQPEPPAAAAAAADAAPGAGAAAVPAATEQQVGHPPTQYAEPGPAEAQYAPTQYPQAQQPQTPYPQTPYSQTPYSQTSYPQTGYAQTEYPPAPYQQPGYVSPYPKNDLAVWSLVLGLAGFVLGCLFVTGIPAVILGRNAQRAVAEGQANNPGLATTGVVLGWVSIALSVGLLVLLGLTMLFGVIALPFLVVGSSSAG